MCKERGWLEGEELERHRRARERERGGLERERRGERDIGGREREGEEG